MIDFTSITKAVADMTGELKENLPAVISAVSQGVILMAGAMGGIGLLKKFIKKVF